MPTANDFISGRDLGDESNAAEVKIEKVIPAEEVVQQPTPTDTICYPYPPEHDNLGYSGYGTTYPYGHFFRPYRPNENKEEEKKENYPQSKL